MPVTCTTFAATGFVVGSSCLHKQEAQSASWAPDSKADEARCARFGRFLRAGRGLKRPEIQVFSRLDFSACSVSTAGRPEATTTKCGWTVTPSCPPAAPDPVLGKPCAEFMEDADGRSVQKDYDCAMIDCQFGLYRM